MNLRNIINEMLSDKEVVYKTIRNRKVKLNVYVNPTPEEMDDAYSDEIRGIKTIKGDIYIVSDQEFNSIIHEDIVNICSQVGNITSEFNNDWWKNINSINHYLCIIWKRNKWYISESYDTALMNTALIKINRDKFLELVKSKYRNIIVK